uniref:Retinoic acid early transcript 1E-like n=1 Tax=Bos indicus x Bos taurus TaxID=30522 RepID=A0A4W2GG41_BOBOX
LLKLQGGMSPAHTTGHLLLILLLIEAGKTLDAHSLCLDLTVKSQSRPGQPWCQVQGSVDTKPFLRYDSASNKVKPLGFLGKEVLPPCSNALVHPCTSASMDGQLFSLTP